MQDAWNVDLAITERRKVGDALTTPLVFQMHVTKIRQCEDDVFLRYGIGVIDDVPGVVVDADPRVVDLGENLQPDRSGRQQVGIRLEAEPNACGLGLFCDRPYVRNERIDLFGCLGVAREGIEDLDAELLTSPQHVGQALPTNFQVQRRMPAHRDATQAVLVEQALAVGDLGGSNVVGVQMLEKIFHRTNLDVLETGL